MSRATTTARFAGLSRLLAGAGLIPAASIAPGEGDDDDEGGEGEGEGEGQEGAGDEGGDGSGDGSGEGGGEGGEDGGEGEGPAADAPPAAGNRSADYQAGVDATNRRWAGILTNESCLSNMTLAVSLMLRTDFSAEEIAEHCGMAVGGDPAALALLDRAPKPKIGTDAKGEGKDGADDSDGDKARKSAVASVNARRAAKTGKDAPEVEGGNDGDKARRSAVAGINARRGKGRVGK
jgi:hypothetical protein